MTERKNEIFTGNSSQSDDMLPKHGTLTFEVPIVDVPLPSNGKVYAADSVLSGKESVTITAMTAAQENILTNRSLAKRGGTLTHLVQSCLKDRSIVARDMLTGDRTAIMVALRTTGYGPEYKVRVECPECENASDYTFDLSKLPLKRLEIEPIEKNSNVFEFSLPVSRARVKFKFLTGADEEDIAVTHARKKKAGLESTADSDAVTSGLLHAIISINGITDRSQIAAALPRMPAYDSQALRKYIQTNEPGVQMKGHIECVHCEYEGEVDMPIGASFFWPGAK